MRFTISSRSAAPNHARAGTAAPGAARRPIDLAESFKQVVATDLSAAQIARAPGHARISLGRGGRRSDADHEAIVDAITIAQALHWFDHPRFYGEVRRVAVPGAAIVAWTLRPAENGRRRPGTILRRLMFETLRGYWPPERRYVDEEYRSIPFPFERIESPELRLDDRWPLAQLTGYMRTWSATARYRKQLGVDPVVDVERVSGRYGAIRRSAGRSAGPS